jgi:transcriptional regulator with XRE-family HTH domain
MVAADIAWDTIAGRLIEGRAHRGLTRAQLSTAAGYTGHMTLWRYENGQVAEPRESAVYRFADALGCDRLWLMYGRGEPNWQPR